MRRSVQKYSIVTVLNGQCVCSILCACAVVLARMFREWQAHKTNIWSKTAQPLSTIEQSLHWVDANTVLCARRTACKCVHTIGHLRVSLRQRHRRIETYTKSLNRWRARLSFACSTIYRMNGPFHSAARAQWPLFTLFDATNAVANCKGSVANNVAIEINW